MIHVLAFITAQPGQRAALLKAFRANVPAVHAEAGYVQYVAVVDAPGGLPVQTPIGEDSFVVVEQWESLEALRAHGTSEHMVAYGKSVRELVAKRVIHVLSPA